ncbi:Lar family restriction alleviation protein [Cupriavidus necator]|uniref:Lar family restriction alleviation protein n=1 Tax=Cupriavidus necator TaxID=106590 RepID=UPI00339D7CEA
MKPCPFCGWKSISTNVQDGIAWCDCPDCGAEGPPSVDEADAIKLWNERDGKV